MAFPARKPSRQSERRASEELVLCLDVPHPYVQLKGRRGVDRTWVGLFDLASCPTCPTQAHPAQALVLCLYTAKQLHLAFGHTTPDMHSHMNLDRLMFEL